MSKSFDADYFARTPLREVMPSLWYPTMMPDTPTLLLFRRPEFVRRMEQFSGDPGPYHIVYVETAGDRKVVKESLEKPLSVTGGFVDLRKTIDRPNTRRSSYPPGRDLKVLLHPPSEAGWPWLVVVMLSRNLPNEGMGRDRYSWDAFDTEAEALDHLYKLNVHFKAAGAIERQLLLVPHPHYPG
ncbi:Hypothetical protein RMHFA_05601 [Roseomonas mucosa]|uniref:hypothetical protein n=1 Tax=Roseomonas TaxID=125216 RepID=UPI000C19E5AD|nr:MULTISPECIES: hypothetical protein [Roseomonas]ATR20215.1 hypothetical protein CTJ15_07825 [Roseomonas sp. FDAARGOS_362]UZO97577.1 Hypothetical protein RMHFA_05601 [Roseomonas mucosa]